MSMLRFVQFLRIPLKNNYYYSSNLIYRVYFVTISNDVAFPLVKNVPPVITNHPRPITINPDTDLSLYCTAKGYPKPDISWRRDGKFIVEARSSYGETLFVPKVRTSGNYTCIASNDAGEVKSSAYVTVRRKF